MAVSSLPVPVFGWTEIVLVLTVLLLYWYYSWTSAYTYWSKRNVPYLKPTFPFGNIADIFLSKKNFRDSYLSLYNQLENKGFGGIFSLKTPYLIVRDPNLIKLMLTKHFTHFVDHGFAPSYDHEPWINNIFFMEGEMWKQMRTKLTPTFTSGKMKMMFSMVYDCSRELDTCLKNIFHAKGTFDAKRVMSRYTFDVIITCFFGLEPTAITDANCGLYKTCTRMFEENLWRAIGNTVFIAAPEWYSRLKLHIFQYDACKDFAEVIKQTIEFRERHNIVRNDFLDLLIRLKNNMSIADKDIDCVINNNVTREKAGDTENREDKNELRVDDVMTQILGFFIGGFETTSSGLSFCLYELARNPNVQVKLQRELDEAYARHGSVTYQMLQELPYIDNVISETLRMYSTLSLISRMCVKPYRIPDTDVVIEKGCRVIIPSYAIHQDPNYYPEPFTFDPDKFLEENVKSRPAYTYLPFGEGPRICIGMRFAKLEMKLALVAIFSQFNVKLNPKTPVPLKIAHGEFLTRTRDTILIDLCDRKDFFATSC